MVQCHLTPNPIALHTWGEPRIAAIIERLSWFCVDFPNALDGTWTRVLPRKSRHLFVTAARTLFFDNRHTSIAIQIEELVHKFAPPKHLARDGSSWHAPYLEQIVWLLPLLELELTILQSHLVSHLSALLRGEILSLCLQNSEKPDSDGTKNGRRGIFFLAPVEMSQPRYYSSSGNDALTTITVVNDVEPI